MAIMADSAAVRMARHRRHVAGDHTSCRRGCQDSRGSARVPAVEPGSGESLDPLATLRDLAAQLWQACQADPGNGVLAKELRATLVLLLPAPGAGLDAEWAAMMRVLSTPVPASETTDWSATRPAYGPGEWPDDDG